MSSVDIVYFLHGKESGPWGIKIQRMAKVATAKGFLVESPDHSNIMDPLVRVEKLREVATQNYRNLVLVGSSMGGYVATYAAGFLKPQGLFLLAPAFHLDEYTERLHPVADLAVIVHGWQDEVIPVDKSIAFARKNRWPLYLVDGDHRLIEQLPFIETIFANFLDEVKRSDR